MNNLNDIYKTKITDQIKEYEKKNDKLLSHLYSSELFNFVEEIPENWSSFYKKLANFHLSIRYNKKSLPFKNFKDLLRYVNVIFFNEINEKLQNNEENSKTTKINFNNLNDNPSEFWKSKIDDYISEIELLLRKILKSNVDNENNFNITMITSNDFAELLKNKSNDKFQCLAKFYNLLKKYNIKYVEHSFLNKSNEFNIIEPGKSYWNWKNKKINLNLKKNMIWLVITEKQDDFRLQIDDTIKFESRQDPWGFDDNLITTKINVNKNSIKLSKAKVFAIKSNIIKRTSNYIKYCLKNNDCYDANGCLHFWAPDAEFKKKILIYGPNGSGKSSLIKELIEQSKFSENLNNQEIMVFDDSFINKHICQKKMSSKEKNKSLNKSATREEKALSKALKFHTDDLKKWKKEKKIYENQKEQLNQGWEKWDKQLFEWFFEIISSGKNKEMPKIHKSFLISWKKYWKKNNILIEKDYGQKDYDWLKEFWTWSFDDLKKQISNHFEAEDYFLTNIKNDFANEYSKTFFYIFLKKQKLQIEKNSKYIENEILDFKKFIESINFNKNIFNMWSANLNLETTTIEKFFSFYQNKSKILTWYQDGIKFYDNFNLNHDKCILCFQQYSINKTKIYWKLKSYNENDKKLSSNLKTIEKIHNKTINIIKSILVELNQTKIEIPGLKKEINNIINLNKTEINFEFDKFDKNKLIIFHYKINRFLSKYLINDESNDKSISYNFIVKNFENNDFKKIIIEFKSAWKWFRINLPKKISNLNKQIIKEEKKITKELREELKIIQKRWNFPIKIELKVSQNSENSWIKIVGKNKENIVESLSVGELKSLAIIIFFLYLKRNQQISPNKKYLIIFDDVFDGLDFTAAFRFNNLLIWLMEDFDKNSKESPTMILLTHQFDFITFFHNQYRNNKEQECNSEEKEFDFFRLFKKIEDSKSKHAFVPLNLDNLIQTNLMIFRKYLNKMFEQFNKQTSDKTKKKSIDLIDLINQVIFWSISRITLEIILTNKINLKNKKVILKKRSNEEFEKYLESFFTEFEEEKKTQKKILKVWKILQKNVSQENVFKKNTLKENILKILQENVLKENILKILKKWTLSNNTFIYISKNNEKKIFNISQKNLFIMTRTFKDFLFELKDINQKEKKDIEKKIIGFSKKYKKNSVIVEKTKKTYKDDFDTTIELEQLKKHLSVLLKQILNNDKTEKFEEITKEDLYVEYVLLQRAIFFLKEKCKKAEELKKYYWSLFIFLKHANNNFFPNLLMFDASFEEVLKLQK